jgi:hypothetical protein
MNIPKGRIFQLLLGSETAFAELLMGVISITFGVWLTTPYAETRVVASLAHSPWLDRAGYALILSGLVKLIGVYLARPTYRAVSCLLAVMVWAPIGFSMLGGIDPARMAATIAIIMVIFNGLVFIRHYAIIGYQKRKGE